MSLKKNSQPPGPQKKGGSFRITSAGSGVKTKPPFGRTGQTKREGEKTPLYIRGKNREYTTKNRRFLKKN